MKSVMITVRVNSTSSGSGYPRNVYNARHERMGDAMGLNDAREVPKKLRKNTTEGKRERETKTNSKWEGGGKEGKVTTDQVQYPGFVETRKFRNSAKGAARIVRLGYVEEGI